MKKIKIDEEDPRLIALAIKASRSELPVDIGVPSPASAGTPEGYFGAMVILKWLTQEGLIDPDQAYLKSRPAS